MPSRDRVRDAARIRDPLATVEITIPLDPRGAEKLRWYLRTGRAAGHPVCMASLNPTLDATRQPRVVVGGGFAGFHAARSLAKAMGDAVEIVIVSPTNYFLYLPLLPEVAAGILEPRRISVSLFRRAARWRQARHR